MHLFVLLPLLLILLLQWQFAPLASTISAQFPHIVAAMILLTATLASLMRQWHWLYSLSLLGSHYYVVQQALQRPLTDPATAALSFTLPLLFTVLMLLLQLQQKPQLLTPRGVLLLLLMLLAPPLLLLLPLADWLALLPLPAAFFSAGISTIFA